LAITTWLRCLPSVDKALFQQKQVKSFPESQKGEAADCRRPVWQKWAGILRGSLARSKTGWEMIDRKR
jgi:hypothetical protein